MDKHSTVMDLVEASGLCLEYKTHAWPCIVCTFSLHPSPFQSYTVIAVSRDHPLFSI